MLTLNLHMDGLVIRDISKEELVDVLALYNQNEENIYATGIDRRMSLEDISEKYLEVLVNSHEFFIGIFSEDSGSQDGNKLMGVMKGRIDYENSEEAWISSILIDSRYQRNGLGSKSVGAVISFLNQSYDVRRVFIGIISGNSVGEKFWQSQGFEYYRTIEQYIKLNNHAEDFIILQKEIPSK